MSDAIVTQRCSCCKITKPFSAFYKCKGTKSGHLYKCKLCYKAHRETPEIKARIRAVRNKYRATEHGQQVEKAYRRSDEGKASSKNRRNKWKSTEHGRDVCRALNKIWQTSKEGLQWQRNYHHKRLNEHPNKLKAKGKVNYAVMTSRIPHISTQKCRTCGKTAQHYHHFSYDPIHWLDVIPFCIPCHNIEHRNLNYGRPRTKG